jgi:hypothetical protein
MPDKSFYEKHQFILKRYLTIIENFGDHSFVVIHLRDENGMTEGFYGWKRASFSSLEGDDHFQAAKDWMDKTITDNEIAEQDAVDRFQQEILEWLFPLFEAAYLIGCDWGEYALISALDDADFRIAPSIHNREDLDEEAQELYDWLDKELCEKHYGKYPCG